MPVIWMKVAFAISYQHYRKSSLPGFSLKKAYYCG